MRRPQCQHTELNKLMVGRDTHLPESLLMFLVSPLLLPDGVRLSRAKDTDYWTYLFMYGQPIISLVILTTK